MQASVAPNAPIRIKSRRERRRMRGRQSSPSAAAPKTRRSMTTPAGPASLKSVRANAAPICTETIAASTGASGGAPRSSILVRALAMRLSVLIYGVTTVDIATSAGRKDDEPNGRTVKTIAKSVRTARVCRDEARFRPEHQCLPERQPGRHLQHRPACTATLWQEHVPVCRLPALLRQRTGDLPQRTTEAATHQAASVLHCFCARAGWVRNTPTKET